jgi:hypothetical protein
MNKQMEGIYFTLVRMQYMRKNKNKSNLGLKYRGYYIEGLHMHMNE